MKFTALRPVRAAVERAKNEPVALANGAAGALGIAVSFGLPITPDQKIGLTSAFVGIANWWARSQVVPVDKLVQGTVAQSGPGEPVTVTPPSGQPLTIGGTS
jgi:hypothetical protein